MNKKWQIALIVTFLVMVLGGTLVAAGFAAKRFFKPCMTSRDYYGHNRQGNRDYSQHDYLSAISEYTEMIKLRPRQTDGYLFRAMAESRLGQNTRAIADNTAGLALLRQPDVQALTLGAETDRQGGLKDVRQALKAHPGVPALQMVQTQLERAAPAGV